MHSDPVADMLTRIRNGCRARQQRVQIPFSNLKVRIAEILKKEGYVDDFREMGTAGTAEHVIEVGLRYDEKRVSVISGIKRLSSPGLRRYYDCDSIPKIRQGLGVIILTTSRGLMTDGDARKARVGGEALCSVW
jgi:small subunit ribosomal protein S8